MTEAEKAKGETVDVADVKTQENPAEEETGEDKDALSTSSRSLSLSFRIEPPPLSGWVHQNHLEIIWASSLHREEEKEEDSSLLYPLRSSKGPALWKLGVLKSLNAPEAYKSTESQMQI